MSKEDFKAFVRNNPILTRHVNDGSMSWQKFYDMYDLYGTKHSIWNEYTSDSMPVKSENRSASNNNNNNNNNEDITLKDLVGMIKKVDLESVRKGIDGVQKTISLIQGFGGSNNDNSYTPRPVYKNMDD